MSFNWDPIEGGTWAFIPWLLLLSSLAIGLFLGFRKRWSTAVYFFTQNAVIWLTFIFAYSVLYSRIENFFIGQINVGAGVDVQPILDNVKAPLHMLFMAIVLIVLNIAGYLVIFPIFLYVRKVVSKDKEIKRRWYISIPTAGLASVMLGTTLHASTSIVFNKVSDAESNWLYKATEGTSDFLAFGKFEDPGQAKLKLKTLLSFVSMFNDTQNFSDSPIGQILSPDVLSGKITPKELNGDQRKQLEDALGDPGLLNSVLKSVENQIPKVEAGSVDSQQAINTVKEIVGNQGKISIPQDSKTTLIDEMKNVLGFNSSVANDIINGLFQ
ncbi:MAG: hypothetical protein NC236_01695 [Mycoplasma sp.]|nr:hypothetical protein [Mycoplasma sp.]